MIALTAIAGSFSLIVGWLVTAKLFALARRTGAQPERLLATAFGGLFCVGYPLGAASRFPGLAGTHQGSLIYALAAIGIVVGVAALNRFPQVVFRPGRRWAEILSGVAATAGVIAGLGSIVAVAGAESTEDAVRRMGPWALALLFSIGTPFLWNAIESALYYSDMKKRLALGLSDPSTTHRFLLWAIASSAASVEILVTAAIRASGIAILSPLPMTIIAVGALVSAACWALAFFMPEGYRARLERRAAGRGHPNG
jgi:hypothetical protein